MRSKELIKAARECIQLMAFIAVDIVMVMWDVTAWIKEDSAISLWCAIAMALCAVSQIWFYKRAWAEFMALCGEVKDK